MRSLDIEASNQLEFYKGLIDEGFTLAEDPANMGPYVGKVVEVEVYCEQFTEKLLAKIYVSGTEEIERSFMLIPVWQIVKYCQVIPCEGEYFTGKFVVGARRILDNKTFVYTLRLPRR